MSRIVIRTSAPKDVDLYVQTIMEVASKLWPEALLYRPDYQMAKRRSFALMRELYRERLARPSGDDRPMTVLDALIDGNTRKGGALPENTLEIRVEALATHFLVNGTEVEALPNDRAQPYGAAGLRIPRGADLVVRSFEMKGREQGNPAPPPVLRTFRPEAPPQLEQLITWCMAKRAEDRPQTPMQLALALQPFCPPVSGAYPTPVPLPVPAAPDVIVNQAALLSAVHAQPAVVVTVTVVPGPPAAPIDCVWGAIV